MALFRWPGAASKALTKQVPLTLSPVSNRGWWNIIREGFAGAWQRNIEIRNEDAVKFFAVYACVSLISQDIGKMRLKLMQLDEAAQGWDGIWTETDNPAFSPVLRKPNHYQNHIKFKEWWITSKLLHGNTYVLKVRDNRKVVQALYVLDPCSVTVVVATSGEIFYQIREDNLTPTDLVPKITLPEGGGVFIPASEIIHDIMVALYHPLCGVSPIHACGLAALQGLKIQRNSYTFFANYSRPGAILSAPGAISDESAARIKTYWEENFTGENVGKVAVLGDDLKYQAMTVSASDAQLIEQLKWTAETVCACFHVPPYKIGIGQLPSYNNVQALNQEYYNQALQNPIESMELSLDEGLGLSPGKIQTDRGPVQYGTELDVEAGILRMDTRMAVEVEGDKIKAGFGAPNESRKVFGLKPVEGGDSPMMQQQNYSLKALAKRDAAGPPPPTKPIQPAVPATRPPAAALPPGKDYCETIPDVDPSMIAAVVKSMTDAVMNG